MIVILEATHGCVSDRGVRQTEAVTVTIASRGVFTSAVEQAAVFALLGNAQDGAA